SFGYNLITVKNYSFSPSTPAFNGKAPIVMPRRIVLLNFGIASIKADLRFDIKNWGIEDPGKIVVYYRQKENSGVFIPLETTYNFVTEKIIAKINGFGEFILASPDLSSILLSPIPNSPVNKSTVNYKLPVSLTWSPAGFAKYYSLQVAADEYFANLLVDEKSFIDAKYNLSSLASNTKYFWRVKTHNDAGESDWCASQSFTAIEPFIQIKKPNGGERWHIGLEYYLEWEDNINEAVTITLVKNETQINSLSNSINSFYRWEIDLTTPRANDYKIKITSISDSNLFDISDNSFSIIDTVSNVLKEEQIPDRFSLYQNYPNPFNTETIISFSLLHNNYTSLKIYNSLGEEVAELVSEELQKGKYSISWNAQNQPSGIYFYKLNSGLNSETKKLILLK
ncbi:MAG: T9SS type A sorting domain-containing protein, partial [Ignavibacteria bacterium]|nr:T9SS type A sorting domain-containing protein [Ignavibacteria bacterium]